MFGFTKKLFIIWRAFFRHKETFVKQKGYSDVIGSLWNHLDKKIILCHREAPLFLRMQGKTNESAILFQIKLFQDKKSTEFY